MTKQTSETQRGISTLHLIITTAFLGALGYMIIIFLHPFSIFDTARDMQRKNDLIHLQEALTVYYKNNARYPKSVSYHISDLNDQVLVWGFSPNTLRRAWPYMTTLPKDPLTKKHYVYITSPDRQAYWIYASLDNRMDTSTCNNGNACMSMHEQKVPENACGGICNYGVSSDNVNL